MKKLPALFLAAAVLLTAQYALAAGPRLVLSQDAWDMGEIYQWTNPKTEITIKNAGDRDLKIQDIKAACGCTAAVVSERLIRPGSEAALKIEFASFNFSGRVVKDVTLVTNDPAAPNKVIPIRGVIKDDKAGFGRLEHETVDLGVIAPYETRFFVVNLYNAGNADLPVTGGEPPRGSFFDSALPDRIAPKTSVPIRVGYRPSVQSGPINDEIVFRIAGFGQTELRLKLTGYVSESSRTTDALIITPAAFKVTDGSKNAVLDFAVKNAGSSPVTIEGVESSIPAAAPAVTPGPELAPGESGRVSIAVDKDALKPNLKGYVYLRVALPVTVSGEDKK